MNDDDDPTDIVIDALLRLGFFMAACLLCAFGLASGCAMDSPAQESLSESEPPEVSDSPICGTYNMRGDWMADMTAWTRHEPRGVTPYEYEDLFEDTRVLIWGPGCAQQFELKSRSFPMLASDSQLETAGPPRTWQKRIGGKIISSTLGACHYLGRCEIHLEDDVLDHNGERTTLVKTILKFENFHPVEFPE